MRKKMSILTYQLWNNISETTDLLSRYSTEYFSGFNISFEQYLILMIIKYYRFATQTDINLSSTAIQANRNINSVSEIVDRMVKNGFVQKLRDLPDRRSFRLVITEKGEQIFKICAQSSLVDIEDLFSIFSKEEKEAYLALIHKLRGRIKERIDVKQPSFFDIEDINNRAHLLAFLKTIQRISNK